MDHADFPVNLVDEHGAVTGTKKRSEINKATDLTNSIFVSLRTPEGSIVLARIPTRDDLPNLYTEKYGVAAATIRRHGELAQEAADRVMRTELGIEGVRPEFVGEFYLATPEGPRYYASVYAAVHPLPDGFSKMDIAELKAFGAEELAQAIREDRSRFAPTFLAIRDKFGAKT